MTRATKTAKSKAKGERSEEFERFENLTKALVFVPKSEIRAEAEKHEKAKKKVRRSA